MIVQTSPQRCNVSNVRRHCYTALPLLSHTIGIQCYSWYSSNILLPLSFDFAFYGYFSVDTDFYYPFWKNLWITQPTTHPYVYVYVYGFLTYRLDLSFALVANYSLAVSTGLQQMVSNPLHMNHLCFANWYNCDVFCLIYVSFRAEGLVKYFSQFGKVGTMYLSSTWYLNDEERLTPAQ